jgi:CSLREA domain-containing protein
MTKSFRSRAQLALTFAVLVSLALSLWSVSVTRASTHTIEVDSFEDKISTDGFCTLREAVIAANKNQASSSNPGECEAGSSTLIDAIVLPPGTYILTRSDNGNEDSAATGDLDIKGSVVISPDGSGPVTITAISGFKDRIFQVLSGNVTITGVTISGGSSGYGGAIHNGGTLTVTDSTITGNKATYWGGGIKNAGTLTLTNVTISGNTSKQHGGGLYNYSNTATLTNVTITANTADSDANGSGDGGGIARYSGYVYIKNTIIAGNTDSSPSTKRPDCSGTLKSQGHNLIQNTTGCTISGTTTGNITGQSASLDPLQNYGGPTATHRLRDDSPAIEAGTNSGCPAADQRGVSRPRGLTCDMGAFEVEDPPQRGPIFTVNTADDADDGVCSFGHCSLREAIHAANARANGSSPDEIRFNIAPAGAYAISPLSALPAISDAVFIDATTQPGGAITLDGGGAGAGANGLTLNAGNGKVRGLTITAFDGDGVRVTSGSGNDLRGNTFLANGGLGINLGSDGVTANDTGDADSGANDLQNFPVLIRAFPGGGGTVVEGRINSTASTAFTLEFFSSPACDPSLFGEGQTLLGSASATTDATGDVYFEAALTVAVAEGQYIAATATSAGGSTSEFSQCVLVGDGNDAWTTALPLTLSGDPLFASADDYIDQQGQSRWYKFQVQPNSRVIVTLTGLPANYDLTVYKDIADTFASLAPQNLNDLTRLGAEFAPDAFSPDAFSPDAFSPDAFSPDAFSPDAFSPDAFSPDAFSPDAFSPDAFSPDAFSPDAFSPDAFSPDAFSPDAFSPDAFSPDAFSPDAFSPDAFSSAQTRSLIGVSAFEGTAGEGVIVNTWNNTHDFYVRVRGRAGVFSLDAPFHLEVRMLVGACNNVAPITAASNLAHPDNVPSGGYKTIILADWSRMASDPDLATLQARLATLAARPEVLGVVVNVGADAKVADANTQADTYRTCPYAKNLVAEAIKGIVDAYDAENPLEYIVIVGNDEVIPFFRHPDQAGLASEQNYVPPVRDDTASQASLKLNYVLSQDDYGAQVGISVKEDTFPIPDLAVGRLVETAGDMTALLDAYLSDADGVITPGSALVTGYDFLEDAARAVEFEIEEGLGAQADTLIADRNLSPQDPAAWTADQLRALLLDRPDDDGHDLIYLAGHFSANSALAADYVTRLLSTDVAASTTDFANALIFSAGCHSGYNIVTEHGVPGLTREPDWAQVFAQKGATLVAGTGYQYGDTDFIEYSERLYLEFSRQLRTGSGPVAVGKALVAAKRVYLANTPLMRGLHEKALLEATLFGLPMMSVNMPGARITPPSDSSIVASTDPFTADPGAALGLQFADVNLPHPTTPAPWLTEHTVSLQNASDPEQSVTATYLSGPDGVTANAAELALPLDVNNVNVSGVVLRGVGFRGGSYADAGGIRPLVGAPTTEIRGVHTPFLSGIFYPVRPWGVNYFDALAGGGATHLVVTPAQFRSDTPASETGTLRKFTSMDFRLYYSGNFTDDLPAISDAPHIVRVSALPDAGQLHFSVKVVGNPAAGIQETWVTWTACSPAGCNGAWSYLPLTQSATDSTLWEGTLALGSTPAADVLFMVQAVNGVGLVSLDTNLGAYYGAGAPPDPAQAEATTLELLSPPAIGAYGTQATFTAKLTLTSDASPLAGQAITFRLGGQSRRAITNGNGEASVNMPLLGLPNQPDEVRASFAGTALLAPSFDTGPFTIIAQGTDVTVTPSSVIVLPGANTFMTATVTTNAGRPLGEKTIIFVVSDGELTYTLPAITDYAGRAPLGVVALPAGSYNITAYFGGEITLDGQTIVVADDRYGSDAAEGTVIINTPPEAVDDAYEVDEDTTLEAAAPGVLGNDFDADGNAITAILVDGPAHGALTLNADGSFTYLPAPGYDGPDSFTYKANDGIEDGNTATVTITVKPVNKFIYGVQNESANVQFFTVDKDTHMVSTLGPAQNGYDIEAVDLDPNTGALYATADSGNTFGQSGWLYSVNTETGLLSPIGFTGYPTGVPGLSFRPTDGVLWGWAKNKGLITIDLSTGAGTLAFAASSLKSIEGIAWNNDGTLMYLVASRDLYVYDPGAGTITKIASNLPGKTEAVDARSDHDGWLALGVHGHTIYTYDVGTLSIVTGESITTPYDDVEGLAWPN